MIADQLASLTVLTGNPVKPFIASILVG